MVPSSFNGLMSSLRRDMSDFSPSHVPCPPGRPAIPQSIWTLGLVSLFMDMSSELIHSLLPIYMVTVLGASLLSVGLIEGLAEGIALLTKMLSGVLSDYLGKRKMLTVIGYGMAAVTKPLFPLAFSLTTVFLARFLDRIGKGIRGAPRDIADASQPDLRGTAFGVFSFVSGISLLCASVLAVFLWDQFGSSATFLSGAALTATALLGFVLRNPDTLHTKGVL